MRDLERVLNYYLAGRLFLPRPRYLCVNATLRCDGRCGHCGIWKQQGPEKEISPQELARVLSAPLFSRVETAWITGGEPTIREDIGELSVAMARFLPSLSTLGIATNALEPERVLRRVGAMMEATASREAGVFVHVSLDGVGEVHDRVRRCPGAFQAVSRTIESLQELSRKEPGRSLEVGMNCVIQPGNVDGLSELFEYAQGMGLAMTFNVALVTDQVYRNAESARRLALSDADKQKIRAFLDRIIPRSPPALRYQYRTIKAVLAGKKRPARCTTLFTTVNINADGTLIPCPASSDLFPRNVLAGEIEEAWRGSEARKMRKRVARDYCGRCMLSCSLGDSMPVSELLRGGWEAKGGRG